MQNILRGKQNRARGLAFEQMISQACLYYEQLGLAKIEKTPEPMSIIERLPGGRFVACFQKKAQPDYKGTLKGGRTVVFESKYTSGGKMLDSVVLDVQAKSLDAYSSLGAVCFILVGFSSGNCYRIPWSTWRNMKEEFGHKYFTEEQAARYKVNTGARLLFLAGLTEKNV